MGGSNGKEIILPAGSVDNSGSFFLFLVGRRGKEGGGRGNGGTGVAWGRG